MSWNYVHVTRNTWDQCHKRQPYSAWWKATFANTKNCKSNAGRVQRTWSYLHETKVTFNVQLRYDSATKERPWTSKTTQELRSFEKTCSSVRNAGKLSSHSGKCKNDFTSLLWCSKTRASNEMKPTANADVGLMLWFQPESWKTQLGNSGVLISRSRRSQLTDTYVGSC